MFKKNKKNQPRRNPTLPSGSSQSGPVVRYYRPQIGENQVRRSKKHHKSLFFGRGNDDNRHFDSERVKALLLGFSQWVVFLFIVFVLFANLIFSGADVVVRGSEYPYRTQAEYQADVESVLGESWLYASKLTLSSNDVERRLREVFPEVSSATVVTPLAGRKLSVTLQVAQPVVRVLVSANRMGVMSANGVVVRLGDPSMIESSFARLPSISIIGVDVQEGMQLVTSTELELIGLLLDEMDGSVASRPRLQSIEYDIQKREMRARFAGVSYYAKLTPERSPRLQVGALVQTIRYMQDQQGSEAAKEYIDVRVDDRVFVR